MENLERQGFKCFMPVIRIEQLRRGILVPVVEALFPRYLFIQLDIGSTAKSWSPIRSTFGVSRLVTFGNSPAKIDDELIALLKSQKGDEVISRRHFEPGQAVVITEGAFAGLEGIYQMASGENRVIVLLDIMSKAVKMSIEPSSIRKAT